MKLLTWAKIIATSEVPVEAATAVVVMGLIAATGNLPLIGSLTIGSIVLYLFKCSFLDEHLK
jgi:hypothetical protein